MKKGIYRVTVQTPKGEFSIPFRAVSLDEEGKKLTCASHCPYDSICNMLFDPRDPENKDKAFSDFCGDIGMNEDGSIADERLVDTVPCDDSLENFYHEYDENSDVMKQLIGKDRLIHLSEVIDKTCGNGFSDCYTPEYENCSACNTMCIFKDLIKNNEKIVKRESQSSDTKELERIAKMIEDSAKNA